MTILRKRVHGCQLLGRLFWRLLASLSTIIALTAKAADQSPVIPTGLDSYRQWDRWPYQRIGCRAYMRGTYDRAGGYQDAGNFLYQLADDNNVTLDIEGMGILYFARYNHWHGSPWRYVVDGTEHLVQETSSADPLHPVFGSVFLPADQFPPLLTWTWADTKGADLTWVPIPFERSFKMGYTRTFYGTGYYIYHQYVRGANLSQPIRTWDGHASADKEVLELIKRAGTDISPTNAVLVSGVINDLGAGQTKVITSLTNGPSMLRKISFSVPRNQALAFGRARLSLKWDERKLPSVDAPVALFFGAGSLYNRDEREFLVKAFPVYIRYGVTKLELACFFPMPFFKSARLELEGPVGESVSNVTWTVGYEPLNAKPADVGYFHATYRDHPNPKWGSDMVFLDTREMEGETNWSGSFLGMSWIFSHNAVLNTLEGDPRFFFDDSQTPQAYGTGTEEWGGGGDYWGGQNMTLPFAGHPVGAPSPAKAKNEEDKIESAYRFLLADLMPFGRRAVIQLEHGENDSREHYEGVTYWYGAPAPALIKTDELKVGDAVSEAAHNYTSPEASVPYAITSRYEWGRNVIPMEFDRGSTTRGVQATKSISTNVTVFPSETDKGRKAIGSSEFALRLDPDNLGVMLRRKLDYAFPNQRAEVYVRDNGKESRSDDRWQFAGIWYLAGANTWVFSRPSGELSPPQHTVRVSNRRFRDDEFLVPRDLTAGRSNIVVRVKFTPVNIPLFPGRPLDERAWSEIRYEAYCFMMPRWTVDRAPVSKSLN